MSNYVIVTESTTDLSAQMIRDFGVTVLPLKFTMGNETYVDTVGDEGLNPIEFYNKLRAGATSTTTQITPAIFEEEFSKILETGNDILYIGFSSGLSGTYNAACMATAEVSEKYPERKIIAVDTLAASMGEGLLVYYASKMKAEGKSIDEVAKWLEDNKLNLSHLFTVDDLNHLKRGGRVSPAVAFVGTILGIKPVMHVDNEGHLVPISKVRGRRASLDALVKIMQDTAIEPEKQTVFISHGDADADVEYMCAQIREKVGVADIKVNYIGPVIGSHSGPGTIAIFFLATER